MLSLEIPKTYMTPSGNQGQNIEGNGMKNNYITNNFINVSAGFEQTDNGNPDVAYGCLILDFSYGGGDYVASISSMENNRYINNTVIADARQSYAFELWGGVNTQIIGNNMTSTGNYPMGIGAIGINTTIDNNTIIADGISNDTEFSADWIKPKTAGIYVYGKMEGCDPMDCTPQAPQSTGFSKQEHWSGLPFPSPMQESEK